jgi:hypothetical protein
MIIVRIQHGLGNQLFQYAAARSVADFRKTELRLEVRRFSRDKLRNYELHHYRISAPIATRAELASVRAQKPPLPLLALYRTKLAKRPPEIIYKEKTWAYDPDVYTVPLPILLVGFFQSPRYFDRIRETLLEELTPIDEPTGQNRDTLDQIQQTNAVFVHVRRGDYVSDAVVNSKHGICSLDYYERAWTYLRKRVASPHLYIFSDDPQWTRENLRFDAPRTYVDHNGPGAGHEDLRLMSHCRHAIIANSSFSWWGAWLGRNPDKIIIAPAQWWAVPDEKSYFGTTKDLCPTEWVRM